MMNNKTTYSGETSYTKLEETIASLKSDEDNVNCPKHYTRGDIECIDAIKASMSKREFEGFLKGNVMKYLWRYRYKNNPTEDLKKAQWYLNKLINNI